MKKLLTILSLLALAYFATAQESTLVSKNNKNILIEKSY
tara:strand:- start:216 stop:332 length:117 start_codon:yes stop_codon:yes gene_type:complete